MWELWLAMGRQLGLDIKCPSWGSCCVSPVRGQRDWPPRPHAQPLQVGLIIHSCRHTAEGGGGRCMFVCLHLHIVCMCSICDLRMCVLGRDNKFWTSTSRVHFWVGMCFASPGIVVKKSRVQVTDACAVRVGAYMCVRVCVHMCREQTPYTRTSPMLGMQGGHLSPHHQPWLWDRVGRVAPHIHSAVFTHSNPIPSACAWRPLKFKCTGHSYIWGFQFYGWSVN